jgi:hypothetical protein
MIGLGAALACAAGWGVGLGCGGKSGGSESGGDGGGSSGGGSGSSGSGSGSSSGGGSGSSSGGTSDAASSGDDAGSPLSGTYKGYIQSFMFPDGTDTVVMTLAFAADGTVTGTVFFGTGPALAPPTDPDVGYPPGYKGFSSVALLEGFEFTVLHGTYAAQRLQVQIQSTELWDQWCALQTKIYPQYAQADDGGCSATVTGYACIPSSIASNPNTCELYTCQQPAGTSIDCGKLALCLDNGPPAGPQQFRCPCTATSCAVPVATTGDIAFDMQLATGSLNGSETGISTSSVGGSQVLNVTLTKQ